jgi:hypothetical protein
MDVFRIDQWVTHRRELIRAHVNRWMVEYPYAICSQNLSPSGKLRKSYTNQEKHSTLVAKINHFLYTSLRGTLLFGGRSAILGVIQKSGNGKEAAQIFWIRGATIARIARRDERDKKDGAKLTQSRGPQRTFRSLGWGVARTDF